LDAVSVALEDVGAACTTTAFLGAAQENSARANDNGARDLNFILTVKLRAGDAGK